MGQVWVGGGTDKMRIIVLVWHGHKIAKSFSAIPQLTAMMVVLTTLVMRDKHDRFLVCRSLVDYHMQDEHASQTLQGFQTLIPSAMPYTRLHQF